MAAISEKKDIDTISGDIQNSFEAAIVLGILEARIKQTLLDQSTGPILWTDVSFEESKKQVSAVIFEESKKPVTEVGIFSATEESTTSKQRIASYLKAGDDFTTNLDKPLADTEPESETVKTEIPVYSNYIRVKRLPTEIEPTLFVQHHLADGNVHTSSLNLLRQIGKDEKIEDELEHGNFSQVELTMLSAEVSKMTEFLSEWVVTQGKSPLKELKEFNWFVPLEYPVEEDKKISFSLYELVDILQINVKRMKELNNDLFDSDQMDLMKVTVVAEADALLRSFPKKEAKVEQK